MTSSVRKSRLRASLPAARARAVRGRGRGGERAGGRASAGCGSSERPTHNDPRRPAPASSAGTIFVRGSNPIDTIMRVSLELKKII